MSWRDEVGTEAEERGFRQKQLSLIPWSCPSILQTQGETFPLLQLSSVLTFAMASRATEIQHGGLCGHLFPSQSDSSLFSIFTPLILWLDPYRVLQATHPYAGCLSGAWKVASAIPFPPRMGAEFRRHLRGPGTTLRSRNSVTEDRVPLSSAGWFFWNWGCPGTSMDGSHFPRANNCAHCV